MIVSLDIIASKKKKLEGYTIRQAGWLADWLAGQTTGKDGLLTKQPWARKRRRVQYKRLTVIFINTPIE